MNFGSVFMLVDDQKFHYVKFLLQSGSKQYPETPIAEHPMY